MAKPIHEYIMDAQNRADDEMIAWIETLGNFVKQ